MKVRVFKSRQLDDSFFANDINYLYDEWYEEHRGKIEVLDIDSKIMDPHLVVIVTYRELIIPWEKLI